MIVGNTYDTTSNFDGLIDDVQIYDYALSVDEVVELYGDEPTPVICETPVSGSSSIYLIGDSTVAEYWIAPSVMGWGDRLQNYFDNAHVVVENKAVGGTSSADYDEQTAWSEVQNAIGSGDYLFIQFGHNDEKNTAYLNSAFQENLLTYVNLARARGAHPVLITPPCVNQWSAGQLDNSWLGNIPPAVIDLAQTHSVPLLDLNDASYDGFTAIGENSLDDYFVDTVHFNQDGAYVVAGYVVEELQRLGSGSTTCGLLPYIQGAAPTCTSQASSACYSGDVYWYDSCGALENVRDDCSSSESCSAGSCIADSSDDYPDFFAAETSICTDCGTGGSCSCTSDEYCSNQNVCLLDVTGSTYFVSPSGSDSASGSFSSPWRTWQHGLSRVGAGDVLYIREGTYEGIVRFSSSGTANAPLTVAGYPGEKAIVDGAYAVMGSEWDHLFRVSGNYVVIRDFDVMRSYGMGVVITGEHNQVINVDSYDNMENGILVTGNYNLVEYCDVGHN